MKDSFLDPNAEILSKPSPQNYGIKDELTRSTRFSGVSMGFGNKMIGNFQLGRQDITSGPG